jgi:hypothetical protein
MCQLSRPSKSQDRCSAPSPETLSGFEAVAEFKLVVLVGLHLTGLGVNSGTATQLSQSGFMNCAMTLSWRVRTKEVTTSDESWSPWM